MTEPALELTLQPWVLTLLTVVVCVVGYAVVGGLVASVLGRWWGVTAHDLMNGNGDAPPVVICGVLWPLTLPVSVLVFIATRFMQKS